MMNVVRTQQIYWVGSHQNASVRVDAMIRALILLDHQLLPEGLTGSSDHSAGLSRLLEYSGLAL